MMAFLLNAKLTRKTSWQVGLHSYLSNVLVLESENTEIDKGLGFVSPCLSIHTFTIQSAEVHLKRMAV